MRNGLDRFLTVVTTGCLVVITLLMVRAQFSMPPEAGTQMREDLVDNWEQLISDGIRLGSPDAPLQIVEFVDFQCPFCRRYHEVLDSLMSIQPDDLSVVYRHLPLSMHPAAAPAAALAECGAERGTFGPVADALYARQDELGDVAWDSLLSGLPPGEVLELTQCMTSEEMGRSVDLDRRLASSMGVVATPTVFVNGYRFRTPPPADSLVAFIDRIESGRDLFPSARSRLLGLLGR